MLVGQVGRIVAGRVVFGLRDAGGKFVRVFVRIQMECEGELSLVIQAGCTASTLAGAENRRQQHRRQDCHNRNDNEKFYQGKREGTRLSQG